MYHIVYLTTNKVNNKIYVGVHSTYNLNDGYIGSGKILLKAIKKHRKENFTRTILHFAYDKAHAYTIESQIVDVWFVKRKDTYNTFLGGVGGIGFTGQDNFASKTKMSEVKRKEKGQKSFKSRKENGNQKLGQDHNFSKTKMGEEKLKKKTQKALRTKQKNGIIDKMVLNMQESKRSNTPKFKFISPSNEVYVIHFNLYNFCKEHNLSHNMIWIRIHKSQFGIITFHKNQINVMKTETQLNTVGWSIYPC